MSQLKRTKVVHDVLGYQINCANYQKCPLCFGCRRYNENDPDCMICFLDDKKKNICNVSLHKDDVTAKMIVKSHHNFNDTITFGGM